jgi:hypothetical protein
VSRRVDAPHNRRLPAPALSSGNTGPHTGSLKNAVVKAAVMASMSAEVAYRAETGPEGLLTRPY